MRLAPTQLAFALATTMLSPAETLPDAAALSSRAAKAFRGGSIGEARALYESALAMQARHAPAWAGLGRIDLIEHRRHGAMLKLARAYQLNPDDPAVVRDYAAASPSADVEITLLERLLHLPSTSAADREAARVHLEIHRKLGARVVNTLASPYRRYRLKMPLAQNRDWRTHGWTLRVRINGAARPLRLLLDTGARSVLLSRAGARGLALEPLAQSSLGGFGDESRQDGQSMLARSVVVDGQLELANVVVEVAAKPILDEIDGLIGTDLFRHFLITFHGAAKQLELAPFEGADPARGAGEHPWAGADPPPPLEPGFHALRRVAHLLMAEDCDRDRCEQFVIDTGSSYTVLHEREQSLNAGEISLIGVSGSTRASRVGYPVRVNLAGSKGWTREAVAADLEPISEYFGVRIAGFLGFPALRYLRISLDPRNNSMRASR